MENRHCIELGATASRLAVSADNELIEYRTTVHAGWPVRAAAAAVGGKVTSKRADVFRAVPDVQKRSVLIERVAFD